MVNSCNSGKRKPPVPGRFLYFIALTWSAHFHIFHISTLLRCFLIVLSLLHLILKSSKCAEVAQCGLFNLSLYVLNCFLGLFRFSCSFFICCIFGFVLRLLPYLGMRNEYALVIAVELDDHERQCFFSLYSAAIFLAEVTCRSVCFKTVLELYCSTLLVFAGYAACVYRSDGELCFICIPRSLFVLFVAQRM